ncbi:restriction endonuclease subunit S [Desulfonatronum thioautotrophicum]|uniref:restriction endonuclease subunit S n=1 Tax=Desulfonatronum thioautotrophicum TaxID=617001 RepID=UPI000A044C5B|nr:restriction endonuclease subunit S [Desulfonatronum thioautotrophicum]
MILSNRNLGELCSLITDGKHGDCKNEEGSGFFFISCKDVKDGKLNYDDARQILQSDFAETHRRTDLKPGDILLTNSGTIGRLAIAPDDDKTARTTFQKSVAVLKPIRELIEPHFLYYKLASENTRLINSASGAAQKNLLLGDLRKFSIQIPSLSKQIRIISILSAYDNLIENNRRRIHLLEQAARLLYKEWFVHIRFPGHEHVKIVDGVPDGWEKKPLGEIAPLKYGKALKNDDRVPGPFPVYGSSGIVGTHTKAFVSAPTIIVGRKGNVGSVYWSPDDCHPIDTVYYIDSRHCSFFLYYALQQMTFISTDVAVPGLNRDFAHSRSMLVAEQKILRLFEDTVSPLHQQMELLKRQNTSLAKARDLLLPKLMNGEVAV